MKNRQNLTDSELDQVAGGTWEPYHMDPNSVTCECGGKLVPTFSDDGPDIVAQISYDYYRCARCGISYHKDSADTWQINRASKIKKSGC